MIDTTSDAWALNDILRKLAEAADILLNDFDYDGHGYEQIMAARDRAVHIVESTQHYEPSKSAEIPK